TGPPRGWRRPRSAGVRASGRSLAGALAGALVDLGELAGQFLAFGVGHRPASRHGNGRSPPAALKVRIAAPSGASGRATTRPPSREASRRAAWSSQPSAPPLWASRTVTATGPPQGVGSSGWAAGQRAGRATASDQVLPAARAAWACSQVTYPTGGCSASRARR